MLQRPFICSAVVLLEVLARISSLFCFRTIDVNQVYFVLLVKCLLLSYYNRHLLMCVVWITVTEQLCFRKDHNGNYRA